MTALALASVFTGAVIFVWGLRAIRNRRVKVLFFQLRNWMSTMIFGIIAMLCGILMIIAGPAATAPPTAELADLMARIALYLFAVGWGIALVLEALARLSSKLFPEEAPRANRVKRKRAARTRAEADIPAGAGRSASSRRLLQTAVNMFLLSGSRLYHRVMRPPRSWDKQNLWHGDREGDKQQHPESKATASTSPKTR
ncbi:MAG: hypothetical protein OXG53_00950 [Chloroflexi bacterium]|nr:hypothetical protein [Chloroflexota bacterium]